MNKPWIFTLLRRSLAAWPCLLTLCKSESALNLFMWNPHWQCFVWNQNDCKGEVEKALETFFPAFDIDFAALVELADSNYTTPDGWSSNQSHCGHDLVNLVFNTNKWRMATSPGSYIAGCMVPNDRPFIVQLFESTSGGEPVIVAGAHFPHPDSSTLHSEDSLEYKATANTGPLRDAIAYIKDWSGVNKVIVIADTNAWTWVPTSTIMEMLQIPSGTWVSTSLERSCCFDAGFPPEYAFDRIMANFGGSMHTTMLYEDGLPAWANQTKGQSRGAFHKPIVGRLYERPSAAPTHSNPLNVFLLVSTTVLATLLVSLIVAWLCLTRCRGSHSDRREMPTSDPESD
ncbi:unnamed protein product [Polarella glacialis]|uniref:Phospholipase B-like n=1 Tax=Polarella glacialis TaxID=89957 RepID=A0A813JI25_POLGL|nr:unnamed protein product [Polarella glacialis]